MPWNSGNSGVKLRRVLSLSDLVIYGITAISYGRMANRYPAAYLAIWQSLPRLIFILGGSWMLLGIAYLAVRTRGFREKLEVRDVFLGYRLKRANSIKPRPGEGQREPETV